jgi:hypothetical protein
LEFGSISRNSLEAAAKASSWLGGYARVGGGLSFLSANLGALELMGWAAAAYQYGILATHFYWIAAFPAMVFLGLVMMPFYYISTRILCRAISNCGTERRPVL